MVARKNAARQSAVRETAAGKGAAGGPGAPEPGAGRDPAAGGPARESPAAGAGAGKPPARKAAKSAPAKKAEAKSAPAKQSAAKKTAAKKTADAGKSTAKKSTAKKAGAARAAEQTGATTVVAKKTPGTATTATSELPTARGAADPGDLPVRPGEDPWTREEAEEARIGLQSEADRLRTEISSSERSLQGLMRDSGDGAGDDEADTGTKNITREHELALAANAREMLVQTERALDRLDAGTYGLCENCGKPIGKARMQAFPRATLCVECKQKQERRP
ncbi:TraR/DksA family transcriptional regulator [Streptomyces sp. AD55]|uniref:TraR/DksA family transcriptional regulator n=1 Tax=Streptomyces sp. AD55 TaxID=3242895 RepID=UPI003526D066